jgi:hypothetical protein
MLRLLASILLALAFTAPAMADEDEDDIHRHALTAPMLEKFQAANRELLQKFGDRQDKSLEDKSIDEAAKIIEAKPGAKQILAKHGFNGRSFQLTAGAIGVAMGFLMVEAGLSKKDQAAQLASYPLQMRANIELVRKNPNLVK